MNGEWCHNIFLPSNNSAFLVDEFLHNKKKITAVCDAANLCWSERFSDGLICCYYLAVTQPETNLFRINAKQLSHYRQMLVRFLHRTFTNFKDMFIHNKHRAFCTSASIIFITTCSLLIVQRYSSHWAFKHSCLLAYWQLSVHQTCVKNKNHINVYKIHLLFSA